MKHKPYSVFCLFVLTLAAVACTFVQAEEPAAEASKERLTFPILFAARHNYQATHIYDTFYHWRLDKKWKPIQNPGVSGIYILENPADPPEKHRIRAVIDPSPRVGLVVGSITARILCFSGGSAGFSRI